MGKETNEQDYGEKLTIRERVAYGCGDLSSNFIYATISAFLLLYYTNVVGMPAATAASILAISKVLDGISDVIMGRIIDTTKSKWGKARPWVFRLCIPLAVCSVLMFSVPASMEGFTRCIYVFITYNLVSTVFYTGVNISYGTMSGLMTSSQYERGLLSNFRALFASAGALIVNSVTLKLVRYFGGGDQYSQKGWTMMAVVYAVISVALFLVLFFNCEERVSGNLATTDEKEETSSLLEGLKSCFHNKYWVYMLIFCLAWYIMDSSFYGSAAYFSRYVLGDVNYYTQITNPFSIARILIMFVSPFLLKKIGKRNTCLLGSVLALAMYFLTVFAGHNIPLLMAANALKGAGFGLALALVWGLLQDAVTYGTWNSGIDAIGLGNAAASFAMKVGSGLGTALIGWIMAAGGFDTNPTGASAAAAITTCYCWLPAVCMIVCCIFLFLFDLDKHYGRIMADLEQGKWRGSK